MKKIILIALFLAFAVCSFAGMQNYCATPPFITSKIPPLVMLVMGKDHKLYYEAYNDASDLDSDGKLDIGYKSRLEYYGYFDSYKCYEYDTTNEYFYPAAETADKYCTAGSGQWSGNFLNWMTMSRMDVLRKVLYGGYRSTDTATETVLEGAYIPQDAHSWGKEFTGADSNKLTPYNDPSSGAVCTLPDSDAVWDQKDKVLLVYYDDNQNNVYGADHDKLVDSYRPLEYSSHAYVDNINFGSRDRINTGNYYFVTKLDVSEDSAGKWDFAIDGDDGVELEIDGTVVATYYGPHGFSNNQSHSGTIKNLTEGDHTVIVRQRENQGGDGVIVYFKNIKTKDRWMTFTKDNLKKYGKNTLRSPYIDDVCRLKVKPFIVTGIPGKAGDGTLDLDGDVENETVGGGTGGRNLFCMTSLSADTPHKIRVLTNSQNRIWEWASKERPVCDDSKGTPKDFTVRVKVCDSSVGLEDNCKVYGANNKPVGLLQKYGASDGTKVCTKSLSSCTNDADCGTGEGSCVEKSAIYFSLLTGSYEKNLSGGVVRKLFGPIDNELNVADGIIQSVPSSKGSIINTINSLGVRGFDYTNKTYSGCGWITDGPIDETDACYMWGNPIAEMMYEAVRYMSGKGSPTSDFNVDDTGLPEPSWDKPFDTYPVCSKPFVIAISDVNSSYDADQMPGSEYASFTGDLKDFDAAGETDKIGTNESVNDNKYFIGVSGTDTDFVCSAKTISTLAKALGTCPEEPTKLGSYYSAGAALYGKTKFSSNFDNSSQVPAEITTYSVALASPIPNIEIDTDSDGSPNVTLTPLGKSVSGCNGVKASCFDKTTVKYDATNGLAITNPQSGAFCPSNQIVDVYLDYINPYNGLFNINFEDVEQGADHDMDAIIKYEYKVENDGSVTISLNSSYASGCIDQVMGFAVSGTTEDGVYLTVRDADTSASDGDTDSVIANMPTSWSKNFKVSNSPAAQNLKNPLWYMAKYGGFDDFNNDGLPSSTQEWDADSDGVPDKYFYVVNPLRLEQELDKVFKNILKETSSGTSISFLSKSKKQGSIISQAVFYPSKDFDNVSLDWTGQLFSYWSYNSNTAQNIREDSNQNKYLEICSSSGYGVDQILDFNLNSSGDLEIDKYDSDCLNGKPVEKTEPLDKLDAIKYLWEGGEVLRTREADNRTIYTVSDNNSYIVPFDTVNSSEFKGYLGSALYTDSTTAFPKSISSDDLINYVRGNDISGCRSRDTGSGIWKLGDVIYSTPQIAEYGKYAMVFTGSNDGMLHAFRAGKISSSGLGPYQVARLCDSVENCTTDELGKEEWAFIPKNSLPYLRYLADPDYCHVYSVDLAPYIIDIDANKNKVIEKRLLIGGMRFGGAVAGCTDVDNGEDTDNCVNPPSDTCSDTSADNCTGRSSYFALDITDPENPKFLWEFTDMYLGFSYSGPAFITRNGINYVVFLSGPTDYDGQAGQDLKMFVLTLSSDYTISKVDKFDGAGDSGWRKVSGFPDANKAFGGRLFTNGVDYNNDGNTDAVFFGINQNTGGTTWQGNLYMLYVGDDDPTKWDVEKIFKNGTGVVTSKVEYMKCFNNNYVYFGTGRWFYKGDDMGQDSTDNEELYGVLVNGCFDDGDCNIDSNIYSAKNTNDYCKELDNNNQVRAYKIDLEPKNGDFGKERLISDPAVTQGLNIVFYSTTEPSTNVCAFGGRSRVWGINCATGGSMFEKCPDGSYATEEFKQTLYLQLSKGNIEDINKDTFNGGPTTEWYAGITPETPPILSPPYSGKSGKLLLWLEK